MFLFIDKRGSLRSQKYLILRPFRLPVTVNVARYAHKSQLMHLRRMVVDPLDRLTMSLLPSKVRRNGLFWLPQSLARLAKVYGHSISHSFPSVTRSFMG